ncbi:MAG: response regulator [Vulcanimicrobiota bacterium]
MKQLLFVDDEPNLLSGLRRMLRSRNQEWGMDFVGSAQEGLARLKLGPCHIVISDMRMPRMDGAEFLNRVRREHPSTVRLCLSGFSDPDMIFRGLGSIHQYLSKPCEARQLVEILSNILQAADSLPPALLERLCQLNSLPVARVTAEAVRAELALPTPRLAAVGRLVSQDLGLSCRLVQLVQSGFFTSPKQFESIDDTCRTLGLGRLRQICASPDGFWEVEEDEWMFQLSRRAARLGQRAAALAEENGFQPAECHLSGLAGRLYGLTELACKACRWPSQEPQASRFLISLWGLPLQALEANPGPSAMVEKALNEGVWDV